jgi:hypothetical protein
MVSFTSLPLYPRGKITQYPLHVRLVGSRADLDDVEKIFDLPGLEL